jgi:hypothetical protein
MFATGYDDLGCYSGPLGPIVVDQIIPNKNLTCRARRRIEKEHLIIDSKIGPLDKAGITIICDSSTAQSDNVVAAKKDADGNYTDARVCHDYRRVNENTKPLHYRLPLPDQLHLDVGQSTVFSKLDARSGFLQIPVHKDSQYLTAFWHRNVLKQYTRMPFGLRNSPAEFQRRMDAAIQAAGLQDFCCVYIDDLLVHSKDQATHLQHLRQVFAMLRNINLKAHPDKSCFGAEVIEFLGHDVGSKGLTPTQAKVATIKNLPTPTNQSSLRTVLGFMNYYRAYVPGYSTIAEPLNNLLTKEASSNFEWKADIHGKAYQQLKDCLCDPTAALKRADMDQPFLVHTDWSKKGIGAVLGQFDTSGLEFIIACISRSLNKAEREYQSYKGELLAVVWAVKSFDFYLRWSTFTIVTDHSPLLFLMKNENLSGQYARWALILSEYDFTVKHRPGIKHQNADALSRFPLPTEEDNTGARMDLTAAIAQLDTHVFFSSTQATPTSSAQRANAGVNACSSLARLLATQEHNHSTAVFRKCDGPTSSLTVRCNPADLYAATSTVIRPSEIDNMREHYSEMICGGSEIMDLMLDSANRPYQEDRTPQFQIWCDTVNRMAARHQGEDNTGRGVASTTPPTDRTDHPSPAACVVFNAPSTSQETIEKMARSPASTNKAPKTVRWQDQEQQATFSQHRRSPLLAQPVLSIVQRQVRTSI